MPDKAQIPGKYIDDAGDDFAPPLAHLLEGLGLLGEDNKDKRDGLNELKEGALSITQWLAGLLGAAGIAGLAAAIGPLFTGANEPTRVGFVGGGALIAASAAIAVALVVRADVQARASSTVAQYDARAQVSTAFLALTNSLLDPPAAPAKDDSSSLLFAVTARPGRINVKTKNNGNQMVVKDVRRTAGGELQIRLEDGD
jgi:hypothetical protein